MIKLEDDGMQRHGVVFVVIGHPKINVFQLAIKNQIMLNAVPIRRVTSHYFFSNLTMSPIIRMWMQRGGEEFQLRSRIHMEGRYNFCSGI